MKYLSLFTSFALIATLFCSTNFAYAQKNKKGVENTPRPIKGVYKTLQDFEKDSLSSDYTSLAFNLKIYNDMFVKKGEEVTYNKYGNPEADLSQGKAVDASGFYAYEDNEGFKIRLVKRGNKLCMHYRILAAGKIYLYADEASANFQSDGNGKITSVKWNTNNQSTYWDNDGKEKMGRYTEFPHVFYIAKGAGKLPITCREENLEELFSDDADLVAKVKKSGLPTTQTKEWSDAMEDVIGWINDYNSKHK